MLRSLHLLRFSLCSSPLHRLWLIPGLRPLLMLGPPRNRACRAVNAAGMCSGTVLFIDIINVINYILLSVGILQNIFIHFCIVQSSFLFVSFQVLAVGHWSYCLLCYCQLCTPSRSTVCHCVTCRTAFTVAVCHPVGFHLLPFRARLFRLRRARSAYLAILYHYRRFHNYLLISVTYVFCFKSY